MDNNIPVKIVLMDGAILPKYGTEQSAGFDIHCIEDVFVFEGETKLIRTGLKMEIPNGYELQLRPRSGLSYKTDLIIKNSPATIDSDYRGEIKIIVKNSGEKTLTFESGERICQGVFNKIPQASWVISSEDDLDITIRGNGGFGHTGK